MEIGFIGLGRMGSGIAANLAKAGHEVKAWNRSGGTVAGVTMVESPEAAVQGDLVFSMLTQDEVIEEVFVASGLLEKARPGLIHLCCATISVDYARRLEAVHAEHGLGYVSAPVMGRPDAAAAALLHVYAAGAPQWVEKALPALEAISQKVWHFGEKPEAANGVKLACNTLLGMAIQGMGEAATLTETLGVGHETFFEVILGTLWGCKAYEGYARVINEGRFEPGVTATIGLKDLRLARELGQQGGARLPMLDAAHDQLEEAIASGLGDRDWAVVADYTMKSAAPK